VISESNARVLGGLVVSVGWYTVKFCQIIIFGSV